MKKIATATIATAGIATFAFAHHDAHKQQNKIIMGTILTTLIHIAILTQSMLKVTTTTLGKVTGVQIV
ncbi:Uncharacterised protein [Mycobacteroides abscessus subsp. massiliense]|nr:Uncharacterised protein [Mycobacteroides abscessus subsp. massiliense]